jgi:hypothetical protein
MIPLISTGFTEGDTRFTVDFEGWFDSHLGGLLTIINSPMAIDCRVRNTQPSNQLGQRQ